MYLFNSLLLPDFWTHTWIQVTRTLGNRYRMVCSSSNFDQLRIEKIPTHRVIGFLQVQKEFLTLKKMCVL